MKLTLLFITLSLLQVNATVFSQNGTFNLSANDVQIKDVLKELEDNSSYRFFYTDNLVFLNNKVRFNIRNSSLEEILNKLLQESPLTYKIFDNNLVVILPVNDLEQQHTVNGKVTDIQGNPLPGVNIIEVGTNNGAVTDLDGNYSIALSSPEATLSFSFIGYLTEEITVNGQTTIDLSMVEDIQALDEVVVVGYGSMKRSDLTGSVSTVDADDLEEVPITSVDEGLQGRAAGVTVTQASGAPGAGISILVRGGNSILGGNQPLYVIDGFPVYNDNDLYKGGDNRNSGFTQSVPLNVLSSINPSDIESIEILKDASATAIYGSRGANGVVLITTKQGKEKTGNVDFHAYYGTQTIENKIDLPTAREFVEYLNLRAEVLRELGNENEDNVFTEQQLNELENYDYQEAILRNATLQNYQLSLTGGGERSKYAISGNYFDQEGIIKRSGFKRYSLRANVSSDFSKKIKGGINFTASRIEADMAATEGGQEQSRSMTRQVARWPAIIPPYDENGEYLVGEKVVAADYIPEGVNTSWAPPENPSSPILLLHEFDDNQIVDKLLGNMFLSYDIVDGLTLKVSAGTDITRSTRDIYWSSLTQYGIVDEVSGGQATSRNAEKTSWLNENTLSYNKTLAGVHSINAVVGFTNQTEIFESRIMTGRGFVTDITKTDDIGGGSQQPSIGSNKWKWSMLSWLGRINYVYNNKYLATVTARADGSSKFSEGNKWGYFPAVALGWRLSEEAFMQNVSLISDAKIRGSWGITGNQEIGSASALATFGSRGYSFDGKPVTGLEPRGVNNPELLWEKTTQTNVGLDLGIFKNRIRIIGDYYQKNTEDLLLNFPLPYSRGISSITKNSGSLENQGIELRVNVDVLTGTFKWQTSLNLASNKNEVTNLAGIENISSGRLAGGPEGYEPVYITEGYPVGIFFGFKTDGMFESEQDVQEHTTTLEDGTEVVLQEGALPGSPKVIDINQDGQINLEDRTVIGDPYPDLTFGWTNNFSYKHFDLSFFIQGVQGSDIYNVLEKNTTPRLLTEVWPNGPYPRPNAANNSYPSPALMDYDLQDGSFIRLKNITLGYNIPLQNVAGFRSARLYVTGKNLITITDYNGYNPDVNSTISTTFVRGIDAGAYPTARSFILGVKLGF